VSVRTALVFPPTRAVTVMPPLGLGYLAAAAQREGFEADIFDLARRHLSVPQLLTRLRAGDYRAIGLSVSTPNYASALKLAWQIKQTFPHTPLVIGGAHPSAFIERSLREFAADYLIAKEAEFSFPQLLRALAAGEDPVGVVDGVYALRDDKLCGKAATRPPENLDALPWPAWEKLEPHRYPPIPHQLFVRRLPVAPILTTRGCPLNCTFCATGFLFGHRVRTRDTDDVVAELRYLRDRFGIREVHFEDDNLTLNRAHAVSLLEKISAAQLDLLFKCPNGVMTSTLDAELLGLLKRAGCYQISLGIETTSAAALDKEAKYIPYRDVRATVKLARQIGLEVQGLFIVGLPYDTEAAFRKTLQDAIDMELDLAHFGVFIPLPGSHSGEALGGCDISTINFFTPHTHYAAVSPRQLKRQQRRAILRFYLRPKPMLKLLSMFKLRQLFGVLNVIRRYLVGI